MTAIQELAAGKLDDWSEAEILVPGQELTATEGRAQGEELSPLRRVLIARGLVARRAEEILVAAGKGDSWSEAEYLAAFEQARTEFGPRIARSAG